MIIKLLSDLTAGKYLPLKALDERIYQKAISRLKTLIRDSLVRLKNDASGVPSGGADDSNAMIIRNLMKSY
jgi:hypothetical protein